MPCFLASAQVIRPLPVPLRNLSRQLVGPPAGSNALRHGSATTHKRCRGARRQHLVERVGLTAINCQAILLADTKHSVRKPAPVAIRQPCGGITGVLLSIHPRTREGQIQEVRGETRLVSVVAAHKPLSCASDRATICSMSVSPLPAKVRPV